MADVDCTSKTAHHGVLVADTVDTLTFRNVREVEIVNVDGAAAIYATVDGGVPTVAGDNTVVVPSVGGVFLDAPGQTATVVRLISSGTPAYSVRVTR